MEQPPDTKAAASRQSSTLSKPSTQMDKRVFHLLATLSFLKESTNGVPSKGGDW